MYLSVFSYQQVGNSNENMRTQGIFTKGAENGELEVISPPTDVGSWRSASNSEGLQVAVLFCLLSAPHSYTLTSFFYSPGAVTIVGTQGQHLYFLDGAHIQAADIELFHGATAETSLPLGIIQPDAVAAFIIFPNEQDECSAISGCILVLPSGH